MRLSSLFFISNNQLERRKGGGGGGKGSSGGTSHGSGSSGGSGGSGSEGSSGTGSSGGGKGTGSTGSGSSSVSSSNSGAKGSSPRPSISSPGPKIPVKSSTGRSGSVQSYGNGVVKTSIIPAGQFFAGRSVGGGTRAQIFGTRQYGSGYPGMSTPGVSGRGFPFGFWPLTFGAATGAGIASRDLHSNEYGNPNNSSRPGGPLFDAPFQPVGGANTYRVLADNTTVNSLIMAIVANCTLSTTSITAAPFNASAPDQPKPEQVIQYYRASSIALTLDGYNNSAVFSTNSSATDSPLPSNLNTTFLDCLNQTIGAAAPLFDGAQSIYVQRFSGFYVVFLLFTYVLQIY